MKANSANRYLAAIEKRDSLRQEIPSDPGGFPIRPKGMWHKTFLRQLAAIEAYEIIITQELHRKLGRMIKDHPSLEELVTPRSEIDADP